MAIQVSVDVRNAKADAQEVAIGASPILRIRTGVQPANCAAARAGTVLSTVSLPADWLTAASNGSKSRNGTWEDLSADAAGTAGHFEIMNNAGTICHMQGTVTANGGGGDMTVDNVIFAVGQTFSIGTFNLTEGGA